MLEDYVFKKYSKETVEINENETINKYVYKSNSKNVYIELSNLDCLIEEERIGFELQNLMNHLSIGGEDRYGEETESYTTPWFTALSKSYELSPLLKDKNTYRNLDQKCANYELNQIDKYLEVNCRQDNSAFMNLLESFNLETLESSFNFHYLDLSSIFLNKFFSMLENSNGRITIKVIFQDGSYYTIQNDNIYNRPCLVLRDCQKQSLLNAELLTGYNKKWICSNKRELLKVNKDILNIDVVDRHIIFPQFLEIGKRLNNMISDLVF